MSMSMCVCTTTLATWKQGRVFDRVFFLGTLENCLLVFVSFSRERAYSIENHFYGEIFYSIISSCLIEFLASRSLTLSISKQDDSVHSISLLIGGHRSCRIPSAAGGEEVQR